MAIIFPVVLLSAGDSAWPAYETDRSAYLYFAEAGGRYLTGEKSDVEVTKDRLRNCREIMEALIEGPRGALAPTLPEHTRVRSVYILGHTVFLDFSSELAEAHPGGIGTEMLTVYSIVNTIVLNLEGIDRVGILVDGREIETLSGHIETDRPLIAQMLLVR